MTTISYRDALSDIINDPEELEVLCEWVKMHKEVGAWRVPRLPGHTLITLIDAIKHLKEGQLDIITKRSQDRAYDEAVLREESEPVRIDER